MKVLRPAALLAAAGLLLTLRPAPALGGARPTIMDACKACHQASETTVRGKLVSVSEQFKTVSVTVGPLVWIVKYGDDLKVREGEKVGGPAALAGIPRDREIAVAFTGGEARPVATELSVKQPYKVPEEQILSLERMRELVKAGPEQGKFTLVDSRPPSAYAEGHIPYAASLPFPAFAQKAAAVLPSDKDRLVVFYCGGET